MKFGLAFCAGVLVLLMLPPLPLPSAWLAIPVLIAAMGGWALRWRPGLGVVLCGLGFGFLVAGAQAQQYLTQRWPVARADERVIARAIVDSIPVALDDGWSFDAVASIESPGAALAPLRVRLVSRDPNVRPRAGDRWRLLLELRPPRARVNPGTPDVERLLFHDRVHALGNVVTASINRRIDAGHRPLMALRESIAQHIDQRVADRDAAALISALAVGATGAMSREQWRVFNATGTTHLVAISGMHVTLFAVIAFAVARSLWSAALWRVVRWPREIFAALVGFTAAAGYATLAGLSVPTQRTLIMLGVWLATRSIARASPPMQPFAIALVAVLLLDPFAPLTAGFWLSFGAMVAIILVSGPRFVPRPLLHEAVAVQGAVTIALTPLTLASFGSVSLVGPLVNAVAIPAMSWIFVPTILLSVALLPLAPSVSDTVLQLAAWMHDIGWPWLAAASDVPWALAHASPPAWWYAAAAVSVFVSLMPWPPALRVAALVWIFPLAAAGAVAPIDGRVEITVLDVGEANSIVVQTSAHTLVYDTGDAYGTAGRTAESVLIPFLRSRGIQRIDVLVVSRLSPISSPGVTALLAEMPVTRTLVGGGAPPDFDGARACGSVGGWQWDAVDFHVLRPDASVGDAGAASCVLSVEVKGHRMLLTGDIDTHIEATLTHARGLAADVVIVPRHGSDSASSPGFIRAVAARWAVVSGRLARNEREKPAVARWKEGGARVLATADLGAIRVRIDPRVGVETPTGQRPDHAPLQWGTLWRSSP